ncbi:MAG: hypothetical protein ACI31S_00525 [Bacilli bacterium]
MKKIIFLIMILFLSGCTVNYDLYIGEKFTDDLILLEDNEKLENIDYYDMTKNDTFNIDNLSYQLTVFEGNFGYEREEITKADTSGYRYKYTYNIDKMKEKSMIYDCYDEINVVSEKKKIIINTSNEFKCFEKYDLLDEVVVNIHYGGELIDTNADSYKDGVYTWKVNKESYKNEKIYLELKRKNKNYTFNIIGGAIFGILTIVSIIVILRKNKMPT